MKKESQIMKKESRMFKFSHQVGRNMMGFLRYSIFAVVVFRFCGSRGLCFQSPGVDGAGRAVL